MLEFPFEAEVTDTHDDRAIFDWKNFDGPKSMDDVTVLEVFYSMKYGVEAVVRKGQKKYHHVLCFLEIYDDDSQNYVELENYKRWRMKYWSSDFLSALFGVGGKK